MARAHGLSQLARAPTHPALSLYRHLWEGRFGIMSSEIDDFKLSHVSSMRLCEMQSFDHVHKYLQRSVVPPQLSRTDYVAPFTACRSHHNNNNLNGVRNFKDTFTLYGMPSTVAITGSTMLKVSDRRLSCTPANRSRPRLGILRLGPYNCCDAVAHA